MLPRIKLRVTGILLRGGCRTMQTCKMQLSATILDPGSDPE